ncbi:hypothetical protein FJTKL_05335 [Diaporthe vaccinii]|uniref:Uncharacterized protein n=1 Tax=Diaporthe vaccinii TaxID=105482 RepID=A0ABR4FFZ2_9PEZI
MLIGGGCWTNKRPVNQITPILAAKIHQNGQGQLHPPLLPPQVAQGALRGPLQRSSQHHERPPQQGAP